MHPYEKCISDYRPEIYPNPIFLAVLMIAPGCVIPQYVSNTIIETAVNTIKNLK